MESEHQKLKEQYRDIQIDLMQSSERLDKSLAEINSEERKQ